MSKRPHQFLPTKRPIEEEFKDDPTFFYENFVKPISIDVLRMASNGIPIDLGKVEQLESVLDDVLQDVNTRIQSNPLISQYKKEEYVRAFKKYEESMQSKKRTSDHYLKTYDNKGLTYKTYVFNEYLRTVGMYDEYGMDKWKVKDIKIFKQIHTSLFIEQLLDKTLSESDPIVLAGMQRLAEEKAAIYNKNYDDKVDNVTFDKLVPDFNPGSSLQKTKFFEMIGLESTKLSKDTGLPSYDKSVIEEFLELVESMIED